MHGLKWPMIKFAPVVLQDGGSEAGMNFAWDEYHLRQINIETAFAKNIEMTGVYHTILKFPEFGPDIYMTEQVHD